MTKIQAFFFPNSHGIKFSELIVFKLPTEWLMTTFEYITVTWLKNLIGEGTNTRVRSAAMTPDFVTLILVSQWKLDVFVKTCSNVRDFEVNRKSRRVKRAEPATHTSRQEEKPDVILQDVRPRDNWCSEGSRRR